MFGELFFEIVSPNICPPNILSILIIDVISFITLLLSSLLSIF